MLRYYIASPCYLGLKVSRFFSQAPSGFRILLFHNVEVGEAVKFEKLVEYVAHHHGILNPVEAGIRLANGVLGEPPSRSWRAPCLFSFDDGFISNLQIVAPILERYGAKGLFFSCPGLTALSGNAQREAIARNVFKGHINPSSLNPGQRLMTWEELSELRARGHMIGCHGMNHLRLAELDDSQLENEIVTAGDLMDERLSQVTDWYAYAFGDIGSIHDKALQKIASRYQFCRSGIRGLNDTSVRPMTVWTDSLAPGAPLSYQKLVLEGGLDFQYSAARDQLQKMAKYK